jgi:hypothetical protein
MTKEEKYLDVNYIKNMRSESRDFQTGNKLKKVEIDDSFPLYVTNNIRKYQDFIVE